MNKFIFTLSVGVALIGFNSKIYAFSNFDGNDLLQGCTEAIKYLDEDKITNKLVQSGLCMGYISGFSDMESMYAGFMAYSDKRDKTNDKNHLFYCPPSNNSPYQNTKIVVAYLNKHPEELHKSAAVLTLQALAEAFPCKQE